MGSRYRDAIFKHDTAYEYDSLAEALEIYTGGVHRVDQAHRWFEQDRVRLLEPRLIHFEALAQDKAFCF